MDEFNFKIKLEKIQQQNKINVLCNGLYFVDQLQILCYGKMQMR